MQINHSDDDIQDDDFDFDDDLQDDDFEDIVEDDIDDFPDDLGDQLDDGIEEDVIVNNASNKKTFLQKFFMPIVIGVIALFAGIFALGQMASVTETDNNVGISAENDASQEEADIQPENIAQNTQNSLDDTQTITDESIPPAPVDGERPNADAPILAADDLSPLTPLPNSDLGNNDNLMLADLEAELVATPDIEPIVDAPTLADIPEELSLPDFDSPLQVDHADEANIQLLGEPSQDIIEADLNASQNTVTEVNALPEAILPLATSDNSEINENIIIDPVSQASDAVENADLKALQDAQDSLMKTNMSLKDDIEAKDQVISDLTSQISELNASLERLKNDMEQIKDSTPVATETVKTVEYIEPVVTETVTLEQPVIVEAPKPVVTKTTPKKVVKKAAPKITWELKSAQPGRATLSAKNSNDLKTVEIGSVLSGLGRIKSIQVENGLWVVRGTQGVVKQ